MRLLERLVVLAALATVADGQASGCACSGSTPCKYIGGTECFAMRNANGALRCPAQTEHCSCACSGDTPCDLNGVCEATVTLYGKQVCRGVGIHCKSYDLPAPAPPTPSPPTPYTSQAAAPTPAPTSQCACGGGTPCLTQQGTCVQMHKTASNALVCPIGATACNCNCGANDADTSVVNKVKANADTDSTAHPCKYVDPSGASFCFAHTGATLGGVTQCPEHTVRCSATVEVKVSEFAALTQAAATAAPNTQPYDAGTAQDSATHAAADQNGVKNCRF